MNWTPEKRHGVQSWYKKIEHRHIYSPRVRRCVYVLELRECICARVKRCGWQRMRRDARQMYSHQAIGSATCQRQWWGIKKERDKVSQSISQGWRHQHQQQGRSIKSQFSNASRESLSILRNISWGYNMDKALDKQTQKLVFQAKVNDKSN